MTLPHTTGTITLTNGSANIVGVGTDWQTAGIVGGMVFPVTAGNVLPILAVQSNTQMTAAVPWAGASGTYSYSLVRDTAYLQQVTENAALLTAYLREMRYPSIAALGALSPGMVADKVPYATGNNTMAWASFTAYGRALVAVATDAAFASAAKVVRRSGGSNMSDTNDIIYGAELGTGVLTAQVDSTHYGRVWNDRLATSQGGSADIRSKIGAIGNTGAQSINGSLTVAGDVTSSAGVLRSAYFAVNAPATTDSNLLFQSGGVNRFDLSRLVTGGETGANAGGDLHLRRWNDAGGYLGTPLAVSRRYGVVATMENPMCQISPGFGAITLNVGQQIGWAGDVTGFNFLRGAPNALFTIGGNPGSGGRVVHVPVNGYYRINVNICAANAGSTVSLSKNGGEFYPFRVPSNNWSTMSAEYVLALVAGDYFAILCAGGPAQVLFTECHMSIELFQLT